MLLAALLALAQAETFAGTGIRGFMGDGGPALKARLDEPFHCELDGKGSLYVAEAGNHCVRRIDLKTGTISTVAGSGKKGYEGDAGPATKAAFNEILALAVTPEGDLYLCDRLNRRIRKVDGKTGIVTTVAGTGKVGDGAEGVATRQPMVEPHDVCLDGKGGLLIADVGAWRLRRLDLKTGTLSVFAGIGRRAGKIARADKRDGGPASKALIHGARAVAVDGKGNTWVLEREGDSLRLIDKDGLISTVASSGFKGPKAVRCDKEGRVYVVDTENHAVKVFDPRTKRVSVVVGKGLKRPHGLAIDGKGVLYIADSENHRVARVQPSDAGKPSSKDR
ncbi:MAG: hypothetical protein K2W96_12235 [Gemmataceae bacterium]|nr:hypothetical protein [Gemmataceae bacterium]